MNKITKLTKKQIAALPCYRDKWTGIGLSTLPADRPRAEAAIAQIYLAGGLQPPPRIVWTGSPLSQGLAWTILKNTNRDSVGASVRASVWDSVWDSVRDSVWASVGDSVGASVRDSVWDSVRDSVWASVRASVRDSVRASVWASGYGQHDANWLAFYDYFRSECGLTLQTEKLSGLTELAQSAGWFLPCKDVCLVSERHNILRRNTEGRLHAEMGPSVEYPDGWQIFALNGVRVPEWMAASHPDEMDARKLLQVENVDQRREGIRRMGMERIVGQLEPKTLNACGDYELLAVDMNHGEPWRFLKMKNPSIGCIHIEAVPRECDTVQQAINWRRYQDVRTDWFPSQLT